MNYSAITWVVNNYNIRTEPRLFNRTEPNLFRTEYEFFSKTEQKPNRNKLDAGMWRYHANRMDARRSQFDLGRVDAYI